MRRKGHDIYGTITTLLTKGHVADDSHVGRDGHGVVEDADPVLDGALVVLQAAQEDEDEGHEDRQLDEAAEVSQGVSGQVHVHTSENQGRNLIKRKR